MQTLTIRERNHVSVIFYGTICIYIGTYVYVYVIDHIYTSYGIEFLMMKIDRRIWSYYMHK